LLHPVMNPHFAERVKGHAFDKGLKRDEFYLICQQEALSSRIEGVRHGVPSTGGKGA